MVKVDFQLSQTAANRKAYAVPKNVLAELKRAAKETFTGELPDLKDVALSVVLMTDEELLQLNISSLGHDWYTDIITFEIDRDVHTLEAELYLSTDRAEENARKAKISTERELVHLVIHGILHLAGYDDHDPAAKKLMKRRERFYLAMF